jgi:hypothetical protein
MTAFPSVQWFDTVREIFNVDDRFRGGGGGMCNALVGFRVGARTFLVTFEGNECTRADEVTERDLDAADFYLEMEPERWREMIENIKTFGHADLHHTLNTLDLDREGGISRSAHGDQYREDLFFRYNQTFQYFFDASARIDTRFD